LDRFRKLFPEPYPVIGLIHLPPLPDYASSPGIESIIKCALADLQVLTAARVDGVLIENEYDRPHRIAAEVATIDAMTRVTRAVVAESRDIVVGCEILLNDPRASLQVAAETGAKFIRTDYFVDRMLRPEYGEFSIDPDGLVAYRSGIEAGEVLILADIQVKYATMLEERSIAESAKLACDHHADAVVVTGDATGHAPARQQLTEAGSGSSVPVLIGSGMDTDNVSSILPACDGAIVGTALMRNCRVDEDRARRLMSEVGRVRAS